MLEAIFSVQYFKWIQPVTVLFLCVWAEIGATAAGVRIGESVRNRKAEVKRPRSVRRLRNGYVFFLRCLISSTGHLFLVGFRCSCAWTNVDNQSRDAETLGELCEVEQAPALQAAELREGTGGTRCCCGITMQMFLVTHGLKTTKPL